MNDGTYSVEKIKLDADAVAFCTRTNSLATFTDLLEWIEAPLTALAESAQDAREIIAENDVHEEGTVDESGTVENVVVLESQLLL